MYVSLLLLLIYHLLSTQEMCEKRLNEKERERERTYRQRKKEGERERERERIL
jgi:hypothetical protein